MRESDDRTDGSREFLATTAGAEASEQPELQEGARIGSWQVESRIGAGGMGSVYRAHRADGLYDQTVALKIVSACGTDQAARFERERQWLARLDHPNIARIIDGGTDPEGLPYLVMEFVEGVPVTQFLSDRSAGPGEIASLFRELCAALGHAHSRLVLHRDIKPSNVLVDADGRVRLIDFGIGSLANETGSPAGFTLASAAPEQVAGARATAQTDIFALGMLLGHMLAGERLRRDPEGGAVLPQTPAIDPDLRAIIAKATAFDPEQRYRSVDAMADDLRAWEGGFPVAARQGGKRYRAAKFVRRNTVGVVSAALVVAALVLGLGVSLWQRQQAIEARDLALAEGAKSEAIRESLNLMLAESAEAGEPGNLRDVMNSATRRLEARFATQPEEAAELLQAVADLQFHLGDYPSSIATWSILEARKGSAPRDVLAEAQAVAAQAHLRMGDSATAAELLGQAQAFWRTDPTRWAIRLEEAVPVEARILREDDPDAAIALLQAALDDRMERSPQGDLQTTVLHNAIGHTEISRGEFDEARKAFEKAQALHRELGTDFTNDALVTSSNLGMIAVMQDRLAEAVTQFERAVALRSQLFGPSGATAALHNNYGKALLRSGRAREAYPQLRTAAEMAEEFSGETSLLHVAALSGLAVAESETGRASALATARRSVRLSAETEPRDQAVAVAHIALAKVHAARGNAGAMRSAVDTARAAALQLGPGGAALIGQIDAIAVAQR